MFFFRLYSSNRDGMMSFLFVCRGERDTCIDRHLSDRAEVGGEVGDLSVLSRPLPLLSFHLLKHRSFLNYFLMGGKGGGGW